MARRTHNRRAIRGEGSTGSSHLLSVHSPSRGCEAGFSDAELTEVLATTQPLQERSVEDVLHQAWKVAANTL